MLCSPFTGYVSVGLEPGEVVTHFIRLDLFMVEYSFKVSCWLCFVKHLTDRMFVFSSPIELMISAYQRSFLNLCNFASIEL